MFNNSQTSTPRRSTRRSTSFFARPSPPINASSLSFAGLVKEEQVEQDASQYVSSSTNASSSAAGRRANGSFLQPSSFFLREKSTSIPPQPSSSASGSNSNTGNLLRGTQRVFTDRYNSTGINSFLSSDNDDSRGPSYNYEAEERLAAELESRQQHSLMANGADTSNRSGKKKARNSQEDMPYQPDTAEEQEDDSDISATGRKHSQRRKSKNNWPNMRNGRDDAKIWGLGRPRRRKPKKVDEHGNEIGDLSYADTTMDSIGDDSFNGSQSPVEHQTELPSSVEEQTELYFRWLAAAEAERAGSKSVALLKRFFLGLVTLLFSAPLALLRQAKRLGWWKLFIWLLAPLFVVVLIASLFSAHNSVLSPSTTSSATGLSWDSFRTNHEAALREDVRNEVSKVLDSKLREGSLLDRTAFKQLMRRELEQLKTDLSDRFNENMSGVQNDILTKIRAQNEMYEKSGSWKPKGISFFPRKDDADADLDVGAKDAVMALIDAALETYSADRIGKEDFALFSSGGLVLPSLTTGALKAKRGLSSWLPFISGPQSLAFKNRPPVLALHPDNSPGSCWPFTGQTGKLGIALARDVLITQVTIEHAARSVTFDNASSAPKEVVVWGLVHTEEYAKAIRDYRRGQAELDDDEPFEPMPTPPSPDHLYIGTFEYDVSPGSRPVQTFAVSNEVRNLQIPLKVVQFEFLSNHGNEEYTCIYRVRVHGEEAQ